MADDVEHATRYNEDFQAYVLEQQQRNREPANYTDTDCVDCGNEIPEKRRKKNPGCRRCVPCQADFELLENWRV